MSYFYRFFLAITVNLFVISYTSHSLASTCSGSTIVPGSMVMGNCFSGNCNGNSFAQSVIVSGHCDDGSQFQADGYLPNQMLHGQCLGGSFSVNLMSTSITWSGSCTNGGSFMAETTFVPGGFAFGTCQVNGSFNVTTPSLQVPVEAQCGVAVP